MTFLYLFIEKSLVIAVEYLVLQGHFTLKVDKNRIKCSKIFFQIGIALTITAF